LITGVTEKPKKSKEKGPQEGTTHEKMYDGPQKAGKKGEKKRDIEGENFPMKSAIDWG